MNAIVRFLNTSQNECEIRSVMIVIINKNLKDFLWCLIEKMKSKFMQLIRVKNPNEFVKYYSNDMGNSSEQHH